MQTREAWKEETQEFEQDWWGDCRNTFGEDAKHLTYARRMGLWPINDGGRWPLIDLPDYVVLDVGGGPTSMLLKTRGLSYGKVVDPCSYPGWTLGRYEMAGIEVVRQPAEDFVPDRLYDEVWCYNVLQHTLDPRAVVAMMRRAAKLVRIFEWVGFAPTPGHPHELHAEVLQDWVTGKHEDYDGWFDVSNVYWDLNIDEHPRLGGRAFHGYCATGL